MKKLYAITFFMLLAIGAFAQSITIPDASPKAVVTQTIGLSDITVTYWSPSVQGRKVWGDLVPYNEIWRAGANMNTTISFEHDVTVNGKPLPAGTYGLHMIPAENEWTIIFSKNSTSWGSYFYKKDEDALRVTTKPQASEFREWLTYEFTERKSDATTLALGWEKLCVPFTIGVDVHKVVVSNMRNELRQMPGFTWEGWYQAASYCFDNNVNTEEAMQWVDRSIRMNANFSNMSLKSDLLAKAGKTAESEELRQKALAVATEGEMNAYGYKLMNQGKTKEAIKIFKKNVKTYPSSWNVYDSLAESFEKSGDNKQAIANYKEALKKAPAEQKDRLEKTIKKLEGRS